MLDYVIEQLPRIGSALLVTVELTVIGSVGALLLGLILAIMRLSPVAVLRLASTAYTELVRNTPLTLVVFFCAFGLLVGAQWRLLPSDAPLTWHNFSWAVVAIILYHATFVAEALRSGVNTVPVGQAEAARAIGLDFSTSLREVILPQALRGAIAPLGNTFIALTKNTTIAATVGVAELSLWMREEIENEAAMIFIIFAIVAAAFVLLTLPAGAAFTRLSEKLAVKR
ncbi:amino acid ABC transporter permease [Parenemella sanctibonifatiensis]|uniref:Glutamate ABC transporter permease n=1 Tax=Parenemella sanctibonifatiensis TaxID=2016505 RepID=A0A255EES7_9ACTN|nr:amino acid ABC transporter permease [Parenemella sanctibonifatiensis]OYN90056.1 glutamate ABC transporter permease [Parenemella sanctibonifatiensis]OYN91257.1 glutamate ABC transporter permease [Parenemella sanctibonifatiensis]